MIIVPKLEMHVADACNLVCDGCAHYSNYKLGGVLAFSAGSPWLRAWAGRLRPVHFSVLGGEPTLNPDLAAYLELVRELWPATRLRLVTNGLLLGRRDDLWPVLAATDTRITISIHANESAYQKRLEKVAKLVGRRGRAFRVAHEFRDSVSNWYRYYRGRAENMEPFEDGQPHTSWRVCSTKHCVTLRDNALWKCPPLAHLPAVSRKLGLGSKQCWAPYLSYQPLTIEATDTEIREFYARGPEDFCAMCPSRPVHYEKSIS